MFYAANVLLFAIPLALFEIWLDASGKKKGPWGDTKFVDPYWGKELNVPFFNLMFSHLTRYHIVLFGYIGLVMFVAEYIAIKLLADRGWIIASFGETKIVAPIYMVNVLVGNMVTEDFLWFAIQTVTGKLVGWGEPQALSRLTHGNFKWHEKGGFWPIVPGTSWPILPKFYFWVPGVIIIIFIIERLVIHYWPWAWC
ncbi:MAG: hypothetical protein KGJ35_00435 [Patescibacteria group bacterium]|nr:hypothetical protein [Patescibacteria group bacterium]